MAADWFRRFEGAGLDGVMAKPSQGTYESNKRVMLKVKHERDCDCVVGGFRWHRKSGSLAVGSLLLGLYDGAGALQHVGVNDDGSVYCWLSAQTRHHFGTTAWYFGSSLINMLFIIALSLAAWRVSLGSRRLLGSTPED